MKTIISIITTLIFIIAFTLSTSVNSVTANTNCHENGDCESICGEEDTVVCTGMDCGSGTQICMKEATNEFK